MAAKYIIASTVGSFVIAYAADYIISDKKIFGGKLLLYFFKLLKFGYYRGLIIALLSNSGSTPHTVSNKEWWEETDKKFQAWPRTAGPPVVMNPISCQNFIVKPGSES